MMLKFTVADLPPGGVEIPLEIEASEVDDRLSGLTGGPLRAAAPLTGRLKLEPTGSRVLVRGAIHGMMRATCARCLEEFNLSFDDDIFVVYTPYLEKSTAEELEAEALNQEFYSGEEIDLWPVIQEYVLLAMPMKPICRDDCPGLCPVCGKNRNDDTCQCDTRIGHPGLAGLQALRSKLPEKS